MVIAMRKLKSLDLVFENIESYTIPASAIHRFGLVDVTRSLSFDQSDQVDERYSCKEMRMVLDNKYLVKHLANQWSDDDDAVNLKDRIIQYNDIAAVDLQFDDKSREYISVPWGIYGDTTNTDMLTNQNKSDDTTEIVIDPAYDHDPFGADSDDDADDDNNN